MCGEKEITMELSGWTIYWVTRLDNIRSVLLLITTGSVISIIIAMISRVESGEKQYTKFAILFASATIVAASVIMLIPSSKEMAAILIIPKLTQNEQVQKIPGKLLTLADEWMEELRPEKEKKK